MDINKTPALGWIGGFAVSNPQFAYPTPNLTSLPMWGNMENLDRLDRQQKVIWPEFSWETIPGDPSSRCYQMFAHDISRLGYNKEGRVYSIICPQQGVCSSLLGCMNVEVTVTGQQGWVQEQTLGETEPSTGFKIRSMAANMRVEGTIWFTPGTIGNNPIVRQMMKQFEKEVDMPFPFDKAHAIKVKTHLPGDAEQPVFPLVKGQTDRFPIPDFAQHEDEAWNVAHLDVEIGSIVRTERPMVDNFNALVMDVFNTYSGNMLKQGNVLSWNVWFAAPEIVDRVEWSEHAEHWRRSIQAGHDSPEGKGTAARYYDGTPFEPFDLFKHIPSNALKSQVLDEDVLKKEAALIAGFANNNLEDKMKKDVLSFLP